MGEEVTIGKHAALIDNLVPVVGHASPAACRAAIERIQKLSTHLFLRGSQSKDPIRKGRR